MSTPARRVRARPASKPRVRTTPSRRAPAKRPPQDPSLRVLRSTRKRKPLAFYVMAIVVVGAMVFGLAATNVLLAQGAFKMRALALEQAQLRQQNGELRLSVAGLSTPNRIAKEAKQIGLVLPDVIEVVHKNGSRGSGSTEPVSSKSTPAGTPSRPDGVE